MGAYETLMSQMTEVSVEQRKHNDFHKLASQLAELNGRLKGLSERTITETLEFTGRTKSELEAAVQEVRRRQALKDKADSADEASGALEELRDKLKALRAEQRLATQRFLEQEDQIRTQIEEAERRAVVCRGARLELDRSARKSPLRMALDKELRTTRAKLSTIERELSRQKIFRDHAPGYVDNEFKQREMETNAQREIDNLETKAGPLRDRVEELQKQVDSEYEIDWCVI